MLGCHPYDCCSKEDLEFDNIQLFWGKDDSGGSAPVVTGPAPSCGNCSVSDIVADRTRFDGNKWTSTPSPSFYEVFGSFHSETCARINDGTVMRETRIRRSVLSTRSKRSKAYKFTIQLKMVFFKFRMSTSSFPKGCHIHTHTYAYTRTTFL